MCSPKTLPEKPNLCHNDDIVAAVLFAINDCVPNEFGPGCVLINIQVFLIFLKKVVLYLIHYANRNILVVNPSSFNVEFLCLNIAQYLSSDEDVHTLQNKRRKALEKKKQT